MLREDGVHGEEPTKVSVPAYWLRGKRIEALDEDMTPSDTTTAYKVSLLLLFIVIFGTVHMVPHVHVIICL